MDPQRKATYHVLPAVLSSDLVVPLRPDRQVVARSGQRRVGRTTMPFNTGPVMPAPIPADEVQRLAELHDLNLLDTEPEERLSRLAELAAEALDMGTVMIGLVDRDRVWFKAAAGAECPPEVKRDRSFAAHAILSSAPLLIPNLVDDDRFSGHELVSGEAQFRCYAGIALRGPTGQRVGALSLFDRRVRVLDPRELGVLGHLARCVEDEIGRRGTTERIKQKAAERAYYDTLTGLSSRRLYEDRVAQAIQWASGLGQRVGIVRLDIDRFRALNNAEGHEACDGVLVELAERLTDAFGTTGTVARWHDDEFAVLMPNIHDKGDVGALVQRVRELFAMPFRINERDHVLSAAIGAGAYPDDGRSAAALLDNAGTALRSARSGSGGGSRIFTAQINLRMARRFELERRLRWAIEKDHLHLVYQPKVDTNTCRIAGMEALLRWVDPDLGAVSPAEFIPVAEESSLIIDIGEWVLRRACMQTRRWHDAGLRRVPVAVNVATPQLLDPHFEDSVRTILEDEGVDPHMINLEVTEGALIKDTERSIEKMHALSAIGVRFSIDDFGTGYSSLAYLRKLPIHVLKVDRAFVQEMVSNPNDAAIVHAIIAMGQSLKLRTVAEGVETREQALFMRAYRCDEIQGFLYSKPVSARDVTGLLRRDEPLG